MTKPIIFDGYEHREMTDTEFAAYQQLQKDLAQEQAARDAEQTAKEAAQRSARNKLAALGLSVDEINALIGL